MLFSKKTYKDYENEAKSAFIKLEYKKSQKLYSKAIIKNSE